MRQQHYEADFRFNLIHVRRNSEQIAFAGSSSTEWRGLTQAFGQIRNNFVRLTWIRTGVDAVQQSITQGNQVIPVLLMLPRIIAREVTLGPVMQARDAYGQFGSAVNWLIQAYPSVAAMIANINRIKALDDAIDHPRPYRIGKSHHDALTIQTRDLTLELPNGQHLLTVGDWTIEPGERWTIQGASGTGKSTLLRALAGIWPDGEGSVTSPNDKRIMFVPQRAYFPIGTLKDAVCFPGNANATDDAEIVSLLELCRLPHLADILHEIKPWVDVLSPGEQQRLAMARVLLHRPDYLFLDEATSALDADNAAHLYASIVERLPGLTLISVVHAEALHRFHTHNFCIVDRRAVIDA
jgi:putative ATP-binding cassette transporter